MKLNRTLALGAWLFASSLVAQNTPMWNDPGKNAENAEGVLNVSGFSLNSLKISRASDTGMGT